MGVILKWWGKETTVKGWREREEIGSALAVIQKWWTTVRKVKRNKWKQKGDDREKIKKHMFPKKRNNKNGVGANIWSNTQVIWCYLGCER